MKIAITSPTNRVHVATCGHLAKHRGDLRHQTGKRADATITKALTGASGLTPCGNCRPALATQIGMTA